ncbi:MAG TPA: hypothetical protein VHX86_16655 [Tepidisphaeraceae bacterium]|nr:hypothetical protein [Tepidisphaeraceae bacterium]
MPRPKTWMNPAVVWLFAFVMVMPALAVTTSHWVQENEGDFKGGTMHNVVVTNLGDVKLSRAVKSIHEQDPNVTTVNALAQGPDGTIYAGTGPKGILLAVKNDTVSTVATIDDTVNILSILVDSKGSILLGTGGDKGRVLRIGKIGDKPKEIFSNGDVQYVWALLQTPDGNIYAATGPNGEVFEIKPDGSSSRLYKSSEDNITSMISDGKDMLYLGTDPNGLVIQLNRKTKEPFIIYNAPESEITALAIDHAGNLYAATGEVSDRQQPPPAEQEPKKEGRPETQNAPPPIPANPMPEPPKPPNPNPGEPQPTPQKPIGRILPHGLPEMMDVIAAGNADDPGAGGDNPGGGGGDNPGAGGGVGDNPGGDQPTPPANPLVPATPLSHGNGNANSQPGAAEAQEPAGNAIYKIDPEGFVTEIFRQNVVIYSMIDQGDSLLVGTGEDGNIYQVNPAAEETVVLAKVDAKQVICLLPVKDGRIFMGLANTGGVSAMSAGYASQGTYLSPVLDATQTSRFGNLQLHGQLPARTALKVSTRSGNVRDADSPGWSKWSPEVGASEYIKIASPPARFLQYRLTFQTSDPSKSALVDHVDVAYQIPNLAPVVKSVKIGNEAGQGENGQQESGGAAAPQAAAGHIGDAGAKTPGGTGTQTITWDASDPNNDVLMYTLYFRMDQGPWILLKDKVKEMSFEWDTRAVADGQYQVKVVASDALSNPPGDGKTASRVSDYFIVDNTPPTIGDLECKVTGEVASISLRAQDRTSIVAGVEYTVDSGDEWQMVLPVGGIFDGPDEIVKFTLRGLTVGAHQVTIRATDSRGNQALQTVLFRIESATARGQ